MKETSSGRQLGSDSSQSPWRWSAVAGGVYDLLGQGMVFPQPYDGWHPPIPGSGRQVGVRLSYLRQRARALTSE